MKTSLFYFSSTGNSLAVAKDIASKLPDTRIFSIPVVIAGKIDLNTDNIGIIFPDYYGGMPAIVNDFIKKLEPGKAEYVFAVCTSASPFPLGTLLHTQKRLKVKGMTLNAGFSIQMPGNYIVKYGAFDDQKQKSLFVSEKKKTAEIAKMVAARKGNRIERNNFLLNRLGDYFYDKMLPRFAGLDKNFQVNDKCTSCGICEKICPVQDIKMVKGRPSWQGICQHCLACLQWCPVEAIEYGSVSAGRKRYHHPDINAVELYRKQ